MATQFQPANVNQDQLQAIQSLEQELGTVLVALEPSDNKYARLSTEELTHLQAFEKQLGMVIVAFNN